MSVQRSASLEAAAAAADKLMRRRALVERLPQLAQPVPTLGTDAYVTSVAAAVEAMNAEYRENLCAEGYKGTLCGSCQEGWGKSLWSTCIQCPTRTLNNLYYALATALTVLVLLFTIHSTLEAQKAARELVAAGIDLDEFQANPEMLVEDEGRRRTDIDSLQHKSHPAQQGQGGRDDFPMPSPFGLARIDTMTQVDEANPGAASPVKRSSPTASPGNAHGRYANPASRRTSTDVAGQSPAESQAAQHVPPAQGLIVETTGGAQGSNVVAVAHVLVQMAEPSAGGADPGPASPTMERFKVHSSPSRAHTDAGLAVAPSSGVKLPESTSIARGGGKLPESASIARGGGKQQGADTEDGDLAFGERFNHYAAHQSTIVRIFISYIQVLALLQNVPIDYPSAVDVYLCVNWQMTAYPGNLVSLECSLPYTTAGGLPRSMLQVILSCASPFYMLAGAMILLVLVDIHNYYKKTRAHAKTAAKADARDTDPTHNEQPEGPPPVLRHLSTFIRSRLRSRFMVALLCIFFVLYPNVVATLLSIFRCQEVDVVSKANPLAAQLGLVSKKAWTVDYSVTCYEGQHMVLAMALGVPGLVLWAVGWPLLTGILMGGVHTMLCGAHTRFDTEMADFYIQDFRPGYRWWESVVMLRKLAISVVTTFVGSGGNHSGLSLLVCIAILIVALTAELYARPYHHEATNALSQGSLCVLLLTLYLSLYFLIGEGEIQQAGTTAVSVVLIFLNICMFLLFVFFILRSFFYSFLSSHGLDASQVVDMTRDQIRMRMDAALEQKMPRAPRVLRTTISGATSVAVSATNSAQRTISRTLSSVRSVPLLPSRASKQQPTATADSVLPPAASRHAEAASDGRPSSDHARDTLGPGGQGGSSLRERRTTAADRTHTGGA